jgi:hypothetical protein
MRFLLCAERDDAVTASWIGLWAARFVVWLSEDGFRAWRAVDLSSDGSWQDVEQEKGIRWMPWHQEAMKDVARCEKPWGAASRL